MRTALLLVALAAVSLLQATSTAAQTIQGTYGNPINVTAGVTNQEYGFGSSASTPIVNVASSTGGILNVTNTADLTALPGPGNTVGLPSGLTLSQLVIYNGGSTIPDGTHVEITVSPTGSLVLNNLQINLSPAQVTAFLRRPQTPLYYSTVSSGRNWTAPSVFTYMFTENNGNQATTLTIPTVDQGFYIIAPRDPLAAYAAVASGGAAATFNRAFGLNQTFFFTPVNAASNAAWEAALELDPTSFTSVAVNASAINASASTVGATQFGRQYQFAYSSSPAGGTTSGKLLFHLANSGVQPAQYPNAYWAFFNGASYVPVTTRIVTAQDGSAAAAFEGFDGTQPQWAFFVGQPVSSSSSSSSSAGASSSSSGDSSSSSSGSAAGGGGGVNTNPSSSSSTATAGSSSSSSSSAAARSSSSSSSTGAASSSTAASSTARSSSSSSTGRSSSSSAISSSTGASSSSSSTGAASSSSGASSSSSSSSSGAGAPISASLALVFNNNQGLDNNATRATFIATLVEEMTRALGIPASQIDVNSTTAPSSANVNVIDAPSDSVQRVIDIAQSSDAESQYPLLAQLFSINGQLVTRTGVNSGASQLHSFGVATLAAAIIAAVGLML